MPLPHPLSLITIVFGILLTMRKLDVSHRLPGHHPSVTAADFQLWQATAMKAYGFGVWACFLKLVCDFGGKYVFSHWPPPRALAMTIGIGLDVAWIAAMVVTFLKVRSTHRLAERLTIEVKGPHPDSVDEDESTRTPGSPPAPGT